MKTFNLKSVLPGANQGFSLIEVLIAMAIFTIGFVAVGSLVQSTTRSNTNGNILTQATMLARAKIEEKKRLADADALAEGTETESNIDEQGGPGGIYTRVCDVSAPNAEGVQTIEVTVSWRRRGQSRNVSLITLN